MEKNLIKYFNIFTKHHKLSKSEKEKELTQFIDTYINVPIDQVLSTLIFQIENEINNTPNPQKPLRDAYLNLLKEYKNLKKNETIEKNETKTKILIKDQNLGLSRTENSAKSKTKTTKIDKMNIDQLNELKEKLLIQSATFHKKLLQSEEAAKSYPSNVTEDEYKKNLDKMNKMKREYNQIIEALKHRI